LPAYTRGPGAGTAPLAALVRAIYGVADLPRVAAFSMADVRVMRASSASHARATPAAAVSPETESSRAVRQLGRVAEPPAPPQRPGVLLVPHARVRTRHTTYRSGQATWTCPLWTCHHGRMPYTTSHVHSVTCHVDVANRSLEPLLAHGAVHKDALARQHVLCVDHVHVPCCTWA